MEIYVVKPFVKYICEHHGMELTMAAESSRVLFSQGKNICYQLTAFSTLQAGYWMKVVIQQHS